MSEGPTPKFRDLKDSGGDGESLEQMAKRMIWERLAHPFFFGFIIAFLVTNWVPVSIFLFSDLDIYTKIEELKTAHSSYWGWWYFGHPALISVLYILLWPWPRKWLNGYMYGRLVEEAKQRFAFEEERGLELRKARNTQRRTDIIFEEDQLATREAEYESRKADYEKRNAEIAKFEEEVNEAEDRVARFKEWEASRSLAEDKPAEEEVRRMTSDDEEEASDDRKGLGLQIDERMYDVLPGESQRRVDALYDFGFRSAFLNDLIGHSNVIDPVYQLFKIHNVPSTLLEKWFYDKRELDRILLIVKAGFAPEQVETLFGKGEREASILETINREGAIPLMRKLKGEE